MADVLAMISLIAGLAIVFGHRVSQSLIKVCLLLLLLPIILSFALEPMLEFYKELPFPIDVVCWIITPIGLLLLLRALLPNSVWLRELSRLLLELSVFVAVFPFRFLWRSFRLVIDREYHSMNLARHHPVVGHQPPRVPQHSRHLQRR